MFHRNQAVAHRSAASCSSMLSMVVGMPEQLKGFSMSKRTSVDVTVEGSQLVAAAKDFKSGSKGFWAGEKVVIDGKRYQVSLSIVEIGSKPTSK